MPRGKGGAGAPGKTPAAELERQIKKFGLSQAQVAKDVGLSVMTLKKLLDGKAKVDIERALVFGKYFGTTPEFWIDLQKKAGLAAAKADAKLQKQLKNLVKAKPVKAEKPAGKTVAPKKVVAKKGAKAAVKKTAVKKTSRKPRSASSSSTATPSSSFNF